MRRRAVRWAKHAAKFAFVALVPALPLLGYACSSTAPLAVNFHNLAPPEHLGPQPRVSTGFPAVASDEMDARRRGPSPFSDNSVRRRAGMWKTERSQVPGWRILTTGHFTVRSDAPIDEMRFAATCLEEGLAAMRGALGGSLPGPRLEARIFRSWREFHYYAATCNVHDAESFYNPLTREIVAYRNGAHSRRLFAETLLHELTHLYVHRAFGRTRPVWLCEGLAEFFSRADTSGRALEVGRADPATVAYLRGTPRLPLETLLRMRADDFYGRDSRSAYAHAWLAIHTLAAARDYGRLSRVRELLADRRGDARPPDPAGLEQHMERHLEELKN